MPTFYGGSPPLSASLLAAIVSTLSTTAPAATSSAQIWLNGTSLSYVAAVVSGGGGSGGSTTGWQVLKVGSGGFVRGMQIAPNGTKVARTDTNGAYLWTGTVWQQLVTASSMPSTFWFAGQGTYEIQVAPSNTSIMYMMFNGYMLKSINTGAAWATLTGFTALDATSSVNPNDNYAHYGQKMAVDPQNPNIVFVGSGKDGLWKTLDGGTTWARVTAVLASTDVGGNGQYPGILGILFDPTSGVVGGAQQGIYAASYGHGVYHSTDGGATWALTASGPTDVSYAAVSSTGVYWAVSVVAGNLWKYSGGAWSEPISGGNGGQTLQAVAVHPNNASFIVASSPSGYLNCSYDGGTTFGGINFNSNKVTSTDIPWIALGNENPANAFTVYMDVGALLFDPSAPTTVYQSAGTGVWKTTQIPTTSGTAPTITWSDMSVGIEQLVANEIVVPPVTGGSPVLASWDRPFFKITDPTNYPSAYGPVQSGSIVAGWDVDYCASAPGTLIGLANWWTHPESGISTDGGATWTNFATVIPGEGSAWIGGSIAASTPTNIVVAPANRQQPQFTKDGGTTWTGVTLPGISNWNGLHTAYYYEQRAVCADRVTANKFYLYYPSSGVWATTDGGTTWANVFSGTVGGNAVYEGANSKIYAVPGHGGHLFYSQGYHLPHTPTSPASGQKFYRSIDGGVTWADVSATATQKVSETFCYGFGKAASGQSYPAIFIVGYVDNVFGIWRSDDNCATWNNIGTYPVGSLLQVVCISGDPNMYGVCYVGFGGGGYAYYSIDPLSASNYGVPPAAPVFSAAPSVSGTPQVGAAYVATPGTATGSPAPTMTYQWKVGGVNATGAGATSTSYTPVSGDVGATLTITQTATNATSAVSSTSSASAVVIAAAVQSGVATTFVGTAGMGALAYANVASIPSWGSVTAGDVVAVITTNDNNASPNTLSLGSNSLTKHATESTGGTRVTLFYGTITSSTSANAAIALAAGVRQATIAVYKISGAASATPSAVQARAASDGGYSDTYAIPNINIPTGSNGVGAFAMAVDFAGSSANNALTIPNVTQDTSTYIDSALRTQPFRTTAHSAAVSITMTGATGGVPGGLVAVWS